MDGNDLKAENEKLRGIISELKLDNELHRAQLSSYKEDFEQERKGRVEAVQELVAIREELEACKKLNELQPNAPGKKIMKKAALVKENQWLKKENNDMKHQLRIYESLLKSKQRELDAAKNNLEAMEDILQKQFKVLNIQMAEAKEEVAVKVAQVKQYQRQVEVYKRQALQPTNVSKAECQSTSSSEPLRTAHVDHYSREQAKSARDSDNGLNLSQGKSQIAASNCEPDGDSKEGNSDDDLPSPIFNKPFQPMYHPILAQGMQKEDISLSESKLPVSCSQMAHTIGNMHLSTPVMGHNIDLADGIDGDILHMVADFQRDTDDRGFEETNSSVPLDLNLKCPKCDEVFKKGRIQKYKHHVQTCGM